MPINVVNGNQVPSAGHGTILIRALAENEWSDHHCGQRISRPVRLKFVFDSEGRGERLQNDRYAKSIKFEKNGRVVLAAIK